MNDSIAAYLARLADQLDTPPAVRASFLEEAHSHLTERVDQLVANGQEADSATAQAISEFGDARSVGARMTAVHPAPGHSVRHVLGMFASGLVLAPLLWLLVVYPFVMHFANAQQVILPGNYDVPTAILESLAPQSGRSVDEVFFGGWTQLIVLLLVQSVVPFWWGTRVRKETWSWLPSAFYGMGALLGLGWAILPTWFIRAEYLPHAHHYTLMTAVTLAIAGLAMLAAYAGYRIRHLVDARRATIRRNLLARHVPPSGLNALRLGIVVPLIILLALTLESATFLQARAETAKPALSLTRQLALAQGHVSFPVKTPQDLPAGMTLTDLLVHPLYDFHYGNERQQWLWLEYQSGAASLIIRENCYVAMPISPGSYCVPSNRYGKESGQITPVMIGDVPGYSLILPTIAVEGTGFNGAEVRQMNVFFTLQGVEYQVASNTLTISQLVAVATSLTQ